MLEGKDNSKSVKLIYGSVCEQENLSFRTNENKFLSCVMVRTVRTLRCTVKMSMLLLMLVTTLILDAAASNEMNETATGDEQDPSKEALRRLFDKYGGRDSDRIPFEGFEHLLESIGLGRVVIIDHDVHDHHTDDGQFRSLHDDHHVQAARDRQELSHADNDSDHSNDHSHHHGRRRKGPVDTSTDQQSRRNGTAMSEVCIVFIQLQRQQQMLCSPIFLSS